MHRKKKQISLSVASDGIDPLDCRIILATQAGLPLVRRPYHAIAEQVGLEPGEVMARIKRMLDNGIIRRIGAVPNHYALGYKANGMSVWDVPDERVDELGTQVGTLPFVSHCYHRPRHLPDWPYNLFAMVHGQDRASVEQKVREIARLLCEWERGHAVLYSTGILKKTGLRLGQPTEKILPPSALQRSEGPEERALLKSM